MSITTHQLRYLWKQITVVLLIAGLILWLPAGNLGFSGRYARAQVTFGEPSPATGETEGQVSGETGGQPAPANAAGGFVSQTVDAVAGTPTALGFVANVAQGNAPTAAQTGAVIGTVVGNVVGSVVGGPVGGLIGGLIGGIIGGLIGSIVSFFSGGTDAPPGETGGIDTSDSSGVGPGPTGAGVGSPAPGEGVGIPGEAASEGGGLGTSGGCFKAGTFIATAISADGRITYRNIETFLAGDEIIGVAFDAEGNPIFKPGRVLRPLRHEAKQYPFSRLIAADGTAIVGTSNHPIITNTRNEGVRMENLTLGQTIVTVAAVPQWDSVAEVKPLADEITPVFNIETTTDNYLVSQDGERWVLVHNGGGK